MGCLDIDFCPLLSLSCYAGCMVAKGNAAAGKERAFLFSSNPDKEDGPKSANTNHRRIMKSVYDSEAFVLVASMVGGLLGIHSIRKFAASFGQAMGLEVSDVDCRGRWKSESANGGWRGKAVVEKCYISPDQPYIDSNAAEKLCYNSPVA